MEYPTQVGFQTGMVGFQSGYEIPDELEFQTWVGGDQTCDGIPDNGVPDMG